MKNIIWILFLFPMFSIGQTINENYTKQTIYKQPTNISIVNPDIYEANVSVTYQDGFGKPIQQIESKQSASSKNIIKHYEYDAFGRKTKEYLPYPSLNDGLEFESNAEYSVMNYVDYLGQNPYSDKLLESSSLNRVLKSGSPGLDWSINGGEDGVDHSIKYIYKFNTSDEVRLMKAVAEWKDEYKMYEIKLLQNGFYDINQLYKNVLKNENWTVGSNHTIEEFTDKEGKLILKRIYGLSVVNGVEKYTNHDTYYVYDQFGNLSYVIPPLVDTSIELTTTVLNNLCYQYKYDNRNRLVEKKLPGKQWEFFVYDKIDRLVASGPVNSPFTSPLGIGWLINKYDYLDRNIITAWLPATSITSATRNSLQSQYNLSSLPVNEVKSPAASIVTGSGSFTTRYTNNAIPIAYKTAYHALTVNYYDDYTTNITFSPAISYTTSVTPQPVYYNNTTLKPKGLPTISWTRVLQTSALFNADKSYILYDNKGRAVRYFKNNYQGGFTQMDSQLEAMTGRVNYTLTTHKLTSTSAVTTLRDDYTYTEQDRLLTHVHKINSLPSQLLTKNTYNELGVLISKRVGGQDLTGASSLQKVDYRYNIRGWLTSINDVQNLSLGSDPLDLFAFKISYNEVDSSDYVATPLYNGNISETHWKTATDNKLRKYTYEYDSMHRLKNAVYTLPDVTVPVVNSYNESLKYDKNGNIKALKRNGGADAVVPAITIDDLSYDYDANSNQLKKVTDNPATATSGFNDGVNLAVEYLYDANGNMYIDRNKGIQTIRYNHLNLPTNITFNSGNYIDYLYSADGVKVSKTVKEGTVITKTDYIDGFQYVKIGSGTVTLDCFPHSEGYVSNDFKYVFQYKDHLGNIRLSYCDLNNNGVIAGVEVLQENHYYPFGMKHSGYNGNLNSNNSGLKYKYNGKEYQDELSLNVTAMDYRQYDNVLGRFNTIDVFSELDLDKSSYTFARNNPLVFNDPTGFCPECEDYYEQLGYEPSGGQSFISSGGAEYTFNEIAGEWDRSDLFWTIEPVIVSNDDKDRYGDNDDRAGVDQSDYEDFDIQKAGFGYFGGDPVTPFQSINIGLGAVGLGASTFQSHLISIKNSLLQKGTQTALNKISKFINPSITAIGKFSQKLGIAGAALTVGKIGYDFLNGKDLKAGQVFDAVVSITLAVATFSNPIALIGFGIYGVLDASGALDSIKSSLGGDTVILESNFK